MTLPASQYSVLDGAKVERLTDDTFRVNVSGFSFFSFEIEPIVTVSVQPTDTGCRIEMLACKLAGSPIIEAQNSKFSARMVNNGVHQLPHSGMYSSSDHISLLPATCTLKYTLSDVSSPMAKVRSQ